MYGSHITYFHNIIYLYNIYIDTHIHMYVLAMAVDGNRVAWISCRKKKLWMKYPRSKSMTT